MSNENYITAYRVVQILKSENLQITEKTISVWKKEGKISVDENGFVSLEEIREKILSKKNKNKDVKSLTPTFKQKPKLIKKVKKTRQTKRQVAPDPRPAPAYVIKNPEQSQNKSIEKISTLNYRKLKGQANKAIYDSKKARIELLKQRGELIERDTLGDSVFAYLDVFNKNLFFLCESLADECIAHSKSENDSRPELIKIWTRQISKYLTDTRNNIIKELKSK